ncbi:hypothetical protein KQX54_006579 [Cotesia glomerata]|uniref:Receptor ligand binding region domain-containing protein n=1 Tax=Cotesia glomerata TaxID=32391 RepID=A0AAV7HPL0_COTGL|nr:hypothetical protein KQX54_006579 [Cotesia glomerata]
MHELRVNEQVMGPVNVKLLIYRHEDGFPHFANSVYDAYVDLVKAWGWKSFTIIYENNEGLVRLQELLKAHGPSEFPIAVRQLGETEDYR